MKKTKVVCIGEALVDRIRNKSNQEFSDFLGGAPANVASALRKLNIDAAFIGRLGSDELGQRFIEHFNRLAVDINFLQLDNSRQTRIVKVDRDQFGDRYFSGFDTSFQRVFADEALSRDLLEKNLTSLETLFLQAKYLVTGTISLTSSASAESTYLLLKIAKKFDVKIIIDLNWRKVFWDSSTFSSQMSDKERINLIKNFLNYAHILKLAKEEAILFFENVNPSEISRKIVNQPDVIVTDGGNPISWFINGLQGITKPVVNSSKIVDTTGAGDAFLAGLISQLIHLDFSINESKIENYIKFASVCGFLTCLGEGAIKQQPSYSKVNEFLGSQIL